MRFKRSVCVLLVVILSFVAVVRPNMQAKAVGTAIASFFAAIPISWPVIAGVLIAGGVGTAAWYSTWEPEEKERFVTEVKGRLLEAQLTVGQLVANAGSTIINGSDYVRGSIVDGLCYLGENITDIIWDVALDNNMLRSEPEIYQPVFGETITDISSSYDIAVSNASDFFTASSLIVFENALLSIWSSGYTCVFTTVSQGRMAITVFKPEDIIGGKFVAGTFGYTNLYLNGYQDGTVRVGKRASSIPSNASDIVFGNVNYNGAGGSSYASFGSGYEMNLTVSGSSSSVPVGEKGQVSIDNEGAWSIPWASDAVKVIDNVGKSIPVSIPHSADWGVDVPATWDIDVAVPDSLVLPLAEAITRALNPPVSITQDYAQEGVIDLPVAVPDTSPVVPDVGQFIVPSFIKDRFPFCIPFDLVRAAKSLSASNTPPEFVYDFHYGDNGVYTFRINFNQFESFIQLFRTAELLLFLVALVAGTRQIMKE